MLLIIYFAQGALYAQGSFISQGVLVLILTISGVYFIKTLLQRNNKNFFYKAFTALLLLNIAGFVFTGNTSNPSHLGQIKGILIVAMLFYPFYYFAQKGVLREKALLLFLLIMLPISIQNFYFYRAEILSTRRAGSTDVTMNAAYSFVYLIPFVFLFKQRKMIAMLAMLVILFFLIQGAKRGALFAGAIGAFYFTYYQLNNIDKKNRFVGYLLTFASIGLLSFFIVDFYQSNEYLINRIEKLSEGVGREVIYANIFNSWLNSDNFLNLLFGFGFLSSTKLSGTGHAAHNDWLELLSSYGLLGISIYAILFYAALKFVINPQVPKDQKILMLAIMSMWFFTTLVSMNYMNANTVPQVMMLAYLVGGQAPKRKYINQIINEGSYSRF